MSSKDFLAAQRYAQALFEIAQELHQGPWIEEELEAVSLALKRTSGIEKFLANPALKVGQKRAILQRIYQGLHSDAHKALLDFFTILFEKNRFNLIHDIALYFKKIADEAQGQGVAEIFSAFTLQSDAEKKIVNRLEQIVGYKITAKKIVDPSLIGGVILKVRNKVIDDSVKTKIHLMRMELTKTQNI